MAPSADCRPRRRAPRRLFSRAPPPAPVPDADDNEPRRSFLAKPPAPGAARRVLSVLRDSKRAPQQQPPPPPPRSRPAPPPLLGPAFGDVVRSPPSPPTPPLALEVDASEVSDSASSRGRRPSSTASAAPPRSRVIAHNFVALDAPVPPAPPAQLATPALRDSLRAAHDDNSRLERALAASSADRAALAARLADAEAATDRQRDARRRLTRRVRHLERALATAQADLAHRDATEQALRAELHALRPRFTRTESTPTIPARRARTPGATSSSDLNPDHAAPLRPTSHFADAAPRVLPPFSDPMAFSSALPSVPAIPAVPAAPALHPKPGVSRTRSVGSVGSAHEGGRRKNCRLDLHQTARPVSSSVLPAQPSLTPQPQPPRRSSSATLDMGLTSARAMARRSLLRRTFIAHIHSPRYRSALAVWHEFLHASDVAPVSPDQFARAVRALALAADARDRDLQILRAEVSGAEECDTGVLTWPMFATFYQTTRHEST